MEGPGVFRMTYCTQHRQQLLQLALPLIRTHGFTRQALANSVLSLPKPHPEPLSDRAVSSLFGEGEEARITLINYWLDDARQTMKPSAATNSEPASPTIKEVLTARLQHNEPVLELLPEVRSFTFLPLVLSALLTILPPGICSTPCLVITSGA